MNKFYSSRRANLFSFLFLLLCPIFLFAQPANDECGNALLIDDIAQTCSAVGQYSNEGATSTNFSGGSCTSNNGNDVWFKFTAIATDLTLTVIGNTGGETAGGTLSQPEAELYITNCEGTDPGDASFQGLECERGTSSDVVELYQGGLVPGQTYHIRVQGRGGREGTFQMCLNNYFPPVEPGSDIEIASVLCDKSKFVIQQVIGTGNDNDEAVGTCLSVPDFFGNLQPSEQSSTWFTWIAANDGSLAFTLTPLNPTDDLDFVVYELPNGLNNTDGKIALRCMASAPPCAGPTGLSLTSTDEFEDAGCDPGEDGFVSAIDMREGVAYGVLINNFSESGNGFSMEFGGDGEFQGPEPQIDAILSTSSNVICAGEDVTFTGANSRFVAGLIIEYEWTFGVGAEATSVTGPGPHTVSYSEPGEKSVVLTLTTDLGCKISDIRSSVVVVEPCCEQLNGITESSNITNVDCNNPSGAIDLIINSNSTTDFIEWSNNANSEDISNLSPGDYMVTITNLATCRDSFPFTVDSIPPFEVTTNLTMPTCGGGTDGAIALNVQSDLNNGDILIDFGMGASQNTTLPNLSAGDYPITISDENGCTEMSVIELRELELLLDTNQVIIQMPTCFDFSNGRIAVSVANGQPGYEYDWNDGNGFVTNSNLNNIPSNTYQLNIRDANLCAGVFEFTVDQPDELTLDIDTTNISCRGADDGMITTMVEGGTGDYQYQWNNNQTGEQITNLIEGTYSIVVVDDNDCQISGSATITEPSLIDLAIGDIQNAACFGDNTGSIAVIATGGNGNYEYSVDATRFQSSSVLADLPAGDYTITVMDPRGCIETINASITQPESLVVDAGEDQTIDLGFSTDIQVVTGPFGRTVDFSWSNPDLLDCTGCPNPTVTPPTTTSFVVTITDETNCTATDSITVFVNPNRPLYIPNVFSPNLDGNNDRFTIFGGPAAALINELQIYDRWGNLVYNGKNLPMNSLQTGWDGLFDGKELPPGVYAFVAQVLFIDDVVETIGGDITLVK